MEDLASGAREEITEKHLMRHLFLPEVDLVLETAGFERIDAREWLTDQALSTQSWSGFVVARKTAQ